jgi:hypothetical protein
VSASPQFYAAHFTVTSLNQSCCQVLVRPLLNDAPFCCTVIRLSAYPDAAALRHWTFAKSEGLLHFLLVMGCFQFLHFNTFYLTQLRTKNRHLEIYNLNCIMKNAIFWDITPRGFCKNRRFGGKYRLHYHVDKNVRAIFPRSVLRLLVTANVPS